MTCHRGGRRLLTAGLTICAAMLIAPLAQAELPEPGPLESGVIAPVHEPGGEAPALLSPVYAPSGDGAELLTPVHSPHGEGQPLLAPVQGVDGTWNQQATEGGEQITLSGEVHFEKNEATLTPTATAILDDIAATWQAAPPQRVTIVGHTDTDGDAEQNQELSERRAQAVADELAEQVPEVEFAVSGAGESEPLRDETAGSTQEQAEAKDQNRRVVLTVPNG